MTKTKTAQEQCRGALRQISRPKDNNPVCAYFSWRRSVSSVLTIHYKGVDSLRVHDYGKNQSDDDDDDACFAIFIWHETMLTKYAFNFAFHNWFLRRQRIAQLYVKSCKCPDNGGLSQPKFCAGKDPCWTDAYDYTVKSQLRVNTTWLLYSWSVAVVMLIKWNIICLTTGW